MIRNAQDSSDAKAKGEKFQKELIAQIQEFLPELKDVIVSSPMSAHGEDIKILTAEGEKHSLSVSRQNTERKDLQTFTRLTSKQHDK